MNLTRQDIEVLLEAVEAWERKDDAGHLSTSLLSSMMMQGLPADAKETIRLEQIKESKKVMEATKLRKDRSIILRAKLIQMRDSADADSLLGEAVSR